MSLAAGREFLAIPGPTVIPDAVLAAMQKPAVDIYAGPLVALTDPLLADISPLRTWPTLSGASGKSTPLSMRRPGEAVPRRLRP